MRKCAVFVTAVWAMALWGCGEPMEAAPAEAVAPAEVKTQEAAVSAADPWVTRHGLTAAQYQAENNHWTSLGYRLTWVTGYEEGGTERFAAIWELTGGPAWVAYVGLTADQYQSTVTNLWYQSYRLVLVNGYSVGGQDRFVAIFHADWSVGWVARHNLTSAQYQSEFNYWSSQGYRLSHVSGYTSYGSERYAAIWVNSGGSYQHAFHALATAQYQSLYSQLTASGYRLEQLSSYNVGGTDMYAGFFLYEPSAPPQAVLPSLTAAQYAQATQDLRYQGFRPARVTAHNSGGTPRFSLLWKNLNFTAQELRHIDQTVEAVTKPQQLEGLSLALTRNGRLVFAKAYGRAELYVPMHTSHRFRIASISKTLTAIGIMRLVQDGRLGLDRTVFGPYGVLGETYGPASSYADPRVLQITVRDLLAHRAGGWDNSHEVDPGNWDPDPMFYVPWLDYSNWDLMNTVLRSQRLKTDPGRALTMYSNFGYFVLGRVIERVTGKTYAQFMQDEVFGPSGATSFVVGNTYLNPRLTHEVVYNHYTPGYMHLPYDTKYMNVPRMDAHGGWVATPVDLTRVLLRADRYSTVPDLLDWNSITTMAQPHSYIGMDAYGNPLHYGLGWFLDSGTKWTHSGFIPGTRGMVARMGETYKGNFTWAVLTHCTPTNTTQEFDKMMQDIINGLTNWPAQDLY